MLRRDVRTHSYDVSTRLEVEMGVGVFVWVANPRFVPGEGLE